MNIFSQRQSNNILSSWRIWIIQIAELAEKIAFQINLKLIAVSIYNFKKSFSNILAPMQHQP